LLVTPFAAWLAWRLYRSRRIVRRAAANASRTGQVWPGADSELYLIEQHLAATGWGRQPHETVTDWAQRVRAEAPFDARGLSEIVEIHCRYRFDPSGIAESERAKLKKSAAAWLARSVPGGS